MHPDIRKMDDLLKEVEAKDDEKAIMQVITGGSFKLNGVPKDIRGRFEEIRTLRINIMQSEESKAKEAQDRKPYEYTAKELLEILEIMRKGEISNPELLRHMCDEHLPANYEKIAEQADGPLREAIMKDLAFYDIYTGKAKNGTMPEIDDIIENDPDIDFQPILIECFHEMIKQRKWEGAWQIYDHLLKNDSGNDEHTEELSEEARVALATEYIKRGNFHPLEQPKELKVISALFKRSDLNHANPEKVTEEGIIGMCRWNRLSIVQLLNIKPLLRLITS